MPAVTPRQIRALWGYASRWKIPEPDLREWVHRRTGKRSLRSLTRLQASRLIEEMERKSGTRDRILPARDRMTAGQARLLAALERGIGWDDLRLLGLAGKMYHVERLQGLRESEAAGLIEAIKAIYRRREAA